MTFSILKRDHAGVSPLPGLALAMVFFSLALQPAAAEWHVEAAPIRFELELGRRPSHAAAGFFVEIPDRGLLPGPAPLTIVITPDGKPLDSYVMWHSPESHLSLVFSDPGRRQDRVLVYVRGGRDYRIWTPESGLTPSAILTTDPRVADMSAARSLARLGPVSYPVHHINRPGTRRAPLSIGGDHTGRPRPASFYMLAHLVSRDPGRTWIAPFTSQGSGEILVNGKAIVPRKRIDKWGGTGDWADIKKGPNRLDIFHASPGSGRFGSRGQVYLTWRTPNASMRELGGVRSENVPMSGTSRMETRIIRDNEIMRSGAGSVRSVSSRDNLPIALARFGAPKIFWFGDETPLLVYRFQAMTDGNPEDTLYRWDFDQEITVDGASAYWILPGLRESRVRLVAANDQGRTATETPFFAFSRRSTSIERDSDRRDFRRAMLAMAEAYPPGHRTVADWDQSYWRNLMRVTEINRGYDLQLALFGHHGDALRANLSADQYARLQDLFLLSAIRRHPRESLNLLGRFASGSGAGSGTGAGMLLRPGESSRTGLSGRFSSFSASRQPGRHEHFAILAAEVYMHYLDDLDSAERVLRNLTSRENTPGQRLVRVRFGDLAMLKKDLNLATRYYAEAQNMARTQRSRDVGRTSPTGDWRGGALLDAAASENVRALLAQGELEEAWQTLRRWEKDMPMAKIGGDFVLLESQLYNRLGDQVRALSMLRAFMDTVESSNFLPDMAPMFLELMLETGQDPGETRDYAERLRKRLEFHPVALHLDLLLIDIPERPATVDDDVDEHDDDEEDDDDGD